MAEALFTYVELKRAQDHAYEKGLRDGREAERREASQLSGNVTS